MYLTTHLPDGTRDVYRTGPLETTENCAWAVVVCGIPELGHITGPGWSVHRYTPTQEHAHGICQDLERTCAVERAVVLPTAAHPAGAPFTAIGFWDGGEIQLVGLVPGTLRVTGGEDVSIGGPWSAHVWAPDAEKAMVEAYRCMDEAVAARQEPLPGI